MKPSGREKPEPDKSSWLRYCSLHLFVLYCVALLGPRPRPAFCHLQYSKVGGAMERGYIHTIKPWPLFKDDDEYCC